MRRISIPLIIVIAIAMGSYLLTDRRSSATAGDAITAGPTANMKLSFEDNFDGSSLDLNNWYPGPKLDGGQWGGAHFVGSNEIGFNTIYIVKDGMLTLRAHYDAKYKDPENWGRTWYSGQITSAFPNGRVAASVRKGYIETRAKFPKNKGSWPAFWALASENAVAGVKDPGGTEVDVFEFYGDAPTKLSLNVIDWAGSTGRKASSQQLTFIDTGVDLTADFHTYGARFTDKEVIIFFDGKEIKRLTLPRPSSIGAFNIILDNAIHTDSGVDIPPTGFADAIFDYVRVWSED